MDFQTPVTTLPFVGARYAKLLDKLGIQTVGQLLYHLPRTYQDLSQITPIAELTEGELQVIEAELVSIKAVRLRGGKTLVNAQVEDDSGRLPLVWFNQPYLAQSLKSGQKYRLAGEVSLNKQQHRQMTNPQPEQADRPNINTGRLIPIYQQTAGLTSKWLRARIEPLLGKTAQVTPEFLPQETLQRHQLLDLPTAMRQLHHPQSQTEANQAKARLAFEEMLLLQLLNLTNKEQWQAQQQAPTFILDQSTIDDWLQQLPFELTSDQLQSLQQIQADLTNSTPMNRLLQGDVGSGKTIIAFLASLQAVTHGYQVAILAPTSVLAQQHYQTFHKLLEGGVWQMKNGQVPTVSLRTAKEKMELADITIGTHAILSESVHFERLGLAIIDEQHRFGVKQRSHLLSQAKHGVHVLTMTATPIPRTLTMTVFGDLDVSTIQTKPKNRLPIKTHLIPQQKRQDMYPYIDQAIDRGEQAYIICPLVEESEALSEVKSATQEFERLQTVFPNRRLGLLHGRLKAPDKDRILQEFSLGQIDILVSTAVVEVGIDVPKATIIVIEGADRFGLAQLHQLRGRVGRGHIQSYCFLLTESDTSSAISRLQHLTHHDSGIQLAEIDLQERGPGEVYGTRQSGIPTLKAASYFDLDLIEKTRQEAQTIINHQLLSSYPELQRRLEELTILKGT